MGLFKRKEEKKKTSPVQTSAAHNQGKHPFGMLDAYMPLKTAEHRLYAALREAVPIIDAAIGKLVRLIGDFTILCKDRRVQRELNSFLDKVQVNGHGNSACCFLGTYLDQMLTFGTAVGEIVPSRDGREIKALYNADLETLELAAEENPLDITVCRKLQNGTCEPVPYQNLILLSALHPQPGSLTGTSILKGLPFVSSILLKIMHTIGVNWERVGNVRFAVTYKPGADAAEGVYTQERAMQIASEWSKAMRDGNQVSDFVSVGDVDIKVIGADNQILDSQVPTRFLLEQIVSKLSIPPFLLGLSWSSTERMSSQQADILTSELEYYRHILNPAISKICTMWLRLHGYDDQFEIEWNHINLQDEVELANAKLLVAQAEQIEQQMEEAEK